MSFTPSLPDDQTPPEPCGTVEEMDRAAKYLALRQGIRMFGVVATSFALSLLIPGLLALQLGMPLDLTSSYLLVLGAGLVPGGIMAIVWPRAWSFLCLGLALAVLGLCGLAAYAYFVTASHVRPDAKMAIMGLFFCVPGIAGISKYKSFAATLANPPDRRLLGQLRRLVRHLRRTSLGKDPSLVAFGSPLTSYWRMQFGRDFVIYAEQYGDPTGVVHTRDFTYRLSDSPRWWRRRCVTLKFGTEEVKATMGKRSLGRLRAWKAPENAEDGPQAGAPFDAPSQAQNCERP